MEQKDLILEIQKLREHMDNLTKRYSLLEMFVGGMFRGAGILVGATLLVLIGGTVLSLLGLLPGFSEIVATIVDAFEKAKIR